MRDVIIIGGNTIGLYTAKLLEKNLDVTVLEEHDSIGLPLQCSGLYSSNIMNFLDIPDGLIQNRIAYAKIHSKRSEIILRKKGTAAYVVDRPGMEKWIAKGLKSEIVTGSRVKEISFSKKAICHADKDYRSEMIIGCDGPNSVVAKHFKAKAKEKMLGLIAVADEKNKDDFVDLWFDKDLIRDGFFWRIPRGKTTEYGAFGNGISFKGLEKFFGIKHYGRFTGTIPLGGVDKSHFNRALLIGDSAAQVKPWSGGGIIYGLYCSTLASGVVVDAFSRNDFSENSLKSYEPWKKKIGKNIAMGMFGRRLLKRMNNWQIDYALKILSLMNLNNLDMDFVFNKIQKS